MHYATLKDGELYAFADPIAAMDWVGRRFLSRLLVDLEDLTKRGLDPTSALCEHGELAGQCELGECWNSDESARALLRSDADAMNELYEDLRIEQLMDEAGQKGDTAWVELCERALDGNDEARAECLRVLDDAKAQEDK